MNGSTVRARGESATSQGVPDARVAIGARELAALREVVKAARDLERTLEKLIRIGEVDLVSSDIGAEAVCSRLNALQEALNRAEGEPS